MRLKEYIILNEDRSIKISEEDALDIIKTKCSKALNAYSVDKRMYRGLRKKAEYFNVDPKKEAPRRSANSRNYYTFLVDNSPKWKGYPKRSESIICSTGYITSSHYGEVYDVFPYDGAKIGVASSSDFWFSFYNTLGTRKTLNDFNWILYKLSDNFDVPIDDTNYKSFNKSITLLGKELSKRKDELSVLNMITKTWRIKSESFIDHLNNLFDPKKNDITLITNPLDLPEDTPLGTEVWTDSKCILSNSMDDDKSPKIMGLL